MKPKKKPKYAARNNSGVYVVRQHLGIGLHEGIVAHINAGWLFVKPSEEILMPGCVRLFPWIVAWKVDRYTGRVINLF